MNIAIEIQFLLAVMFIAVACPALGLSLLQPFDKALRALGRRPKLSIVFVGGLAFCINGALGLLVHLPVPAVHDEFAYLLTADTFADGRLTNPTHPHWEHFASYHIFHEPSYQAKFPPGQGLVLALGQALCGEPIVGVWLSTALACAAVCWMLQGWLPSRWAVLGALLFVVSPRVIVFWSQSYWGGSLSLAGGALVYGALPRILKNQRYRDAVWLAVGLVILANTRMYEGFIAALPVAGVLAFWLGTPKRPEWVVVLRRVVAPVLLVLVTATACMGTYNAHVTGSAWRTPYQVWLEQYSVSLSETLFRWIPQDDESDDRNSRASATVETQTATLLPSAMQPAEKFTKSRQGFASGTPFKFLIQWGFYVMPLLTPCLLAGMFGWRNKGMRLAILSAGLVLFVVIVGRTAGYPHYSAPVGGLILLIVMQGLRRLQLWAWRGKPSGQFLRMGIPAGCVLMSAFSILAQWVEQPVSASYHWALAREQIQTELANRPGDDLVIVRYTTDHNHHNEWVYNRADIDGAGVVWARDLGAIKNGQLIEYFHDRDVWLLEADKSPYRVSRYIEGYRDPLMVDKQ